MSSQRPTLAVVVVTIVVLLVAGGVTAAVVLSDDDDSAAAPSDRGTLVADPDPAPSEQPTPTADPTPAPTTASAGTRGLNPCDLVTRLDATRLGLGAGEKDSLVPRTCTRHRGRPTGVTKRIPGVGALVRDGGGRLLLVLRSRPPAAGTWSLPGGRIEPGESAEAACVREVAEETGLVVEVVRHVGQVERPAPGGGTYVIDDYACRTVGGALRAGDDAGDARFVSGAELNRLPLAPLLRETLRDWGELG